MAQAQLSVQVSCHAGYQGEQTPRRFALGRREREIVEVIDRWLDPRHCYFKVRADDGGIYILRHDVDSAQWELTLFDSGDRPETRLSST